MNTDFQRRLARFSGAGQKPSLVVGFGLGKCFFYPC
jgi:hypothetical protein